MLESVLIQNFKGFKNTLISPFRKVNLIIGGQNVGKTSVLEAVQICLGGFEATAFRQNEGTDAHHFSASVMANPDLTLYAKYSAREFVLTRRTPFDPSSVSAKSKDFYGLGAFSGPFGVSHRYSNESARQDPTPRCVAIPLFLPPQMHLVMLFGKVILTRKKRELTELLRKVEPRLISLDAIAPDGEQRVYAELEGVDQALPLTQMGHGFSRLVYLFSEMLVSDAQIALIDEVENGIHYSALPTLFQGIKTVAQERDVQSLITTHSWDGLRAACEVFEDTPDMFQVIRLERDEDEVKAVCIDGARMLRLMADEREVR
ncbi:AAA family ATPase [Hydrogenophaga sp.]|uniref:AAA family ATPase n=1 Tax=Hydrogenophaga sp. TaxID=1904254 RepID=UPI003AF7495E